MRFFKETHIDFMRYRKIAYTISISVIVIGMISFISRGKKNFGIDFTGGSLVRCKFAQVVDVGNIRASLQEANLSGSTIQSYEGGKGIIIRAAGDKRKEIGELLTKKFEYAGPTIEEEVSIGPVVGALLQKQAIIAITLSLISILIYIAWRFKFIWGFSAIVCLFHDALFMGGIFALTHKEISISLIAAILTVLGYSDNDTIVVFDRIRENLKISRNKPLPEVINASINQTLSRTVITSFTTLIPVIVLLFLGGPVIKDFAFALTIGIVEGTYSSIYVASPLVIELSKIFKIKHKVS